MKKFLLSLFAVAATFAASAAETTYTVDFTSTVDGKVLATTVGSAISNKTEAILTLNGDTWTFKNATTGGSTAQKDSSGRGLQIGSKNEVPKTITFSTNAFNTKTIKAVKLELAGNGGNYTITVDGTSVQNQNGTYAASSKTETVTATWTAETPVSCTTGFSFAITAGTGKALFIKSFTITYDEASVPVDPNALGKPVIAYGDESFSDDGKEVSVPYGTEFTISAANAENITITNATGTLLTENVSECTWTPDVMAKNSITVTSKKGEQTLSTSFSLTVLDNAQVSAPWTLVTDLNQINDNFEYIIASQGEYTTNSKTYQFAYTMVNTEVAANVLGTADVTITNNTIDNIAENTAIFSITKGSDGLYTFMTNVGGVDKYLTAPAKNKSTLKESATSLSLSIATDGTAAISTTITDSGTEKVATLYANPNSGNNQRFAFYTSSSMKPVQLYCRQKPASKPVTPDATVDGTTIANEGTIDLKGSAKTIKFEGLADGVNIWYKFTPTTTDVAVAAEYVPEDSDFKKYDANTGIELTKAGELTYYAEKDGVVGDTYTINVKGTTTGISEIEAEGAATEWFDLSGRRVAAPAKGIYLRKQGSKVTKIAY